MEEVYALCFNREDPDPDGSGIFDKLDSHPLQKLDLDPCKNLPDPQSCHMNALYS